MIEMPFDLANSTHKSFPNEPISPRFATLDHYIKYDSPRCPFCRVTYFASEFAEHRYQCKALPEMTPAERGMAWRKAQRERRAEYVREKR